MPKSRKRSRSVFAKSKRPFKRRLFSPNRGRNVFKRKTYRRRRSYKRRGKVNTIANKVKSIQKQMKNDLGTAIHREKSAGAVTCAAKTCTFSMLGIWDYVNMDNELKFLRYYNPSAPSTLTTADGTTGSYKKSFLFKEIVTKITLRNNYQSPANITIYLFRPRVDTNDTVYTSYTNGLADVGAPSATALTTYPTDSPVLMELYKIEKSKKVLLMPGSTTSMSFVQKDISYEPYVVDVHGDAMQARYGAHCFAIRMTGVPGHDSTLDEQGIGPAAVDFVFDTKTKIVYDAGVNCTTISGTDNTDTFTNAFQFSQRPANAQQNYTTA